MSYFFLSTKALKEINDKLREFFWSGVGLNHYKAKMTWKDIYAPKEEEGLGIIFAKH